jgi:drug/metabolite transporter (DMT)-like permease
MKPMRLSRSMVVAVLCLLVATLFWAGNYVVGKIAIAEFSPLSLVYLRWLLALVPLFLVAQVVERPSWRQALRAWPWLLALSVFGLAGYNFLLYAALQFTDAFNASLINAFNPALIVLASVLFLRERLSWAGIVGLLLALAGVLIILSKGSLLTLLDAQHNSGDLLMLGAIVSWTAYTVIGRRAPRLPPITSTALQGLVLVVGLTPIAAVQGIDLPQSSGGFWSLAYIAVFPSLLSYVLWNRALQTIEPAKAGVFLNLITVFTAVLTILMGQPLTIAQVIGGMIVIAGVALANKQAFTRRQPALLPHASSDPAAPRGMSS